MNKNNKLREKVDSAIELNIYTRYNDVYNKLRIIFLYTTIMYVIILL